MNAIGESNRVIITVLGKDEVGIIAWIATRLANNHANILDISQTIMQGMFTMIMIVDVSGVGLEFAKLREILAAEGEQRGLKVTVQHEDVFQFMHRI